jgi:D-glycero-alpha-D-manno-heptose-7-phosphate kinase
VQLPHVGDTFGMIITRTPTRISFVGGGSDMPSYYRRHGGAVLSTAIKRFIYIAVNQKFDNRIRLNYSRTEEVDRPDEIKHPLVRHVLDMEKVECGIEISSVADIPSHGSGLGSSSAFTVGLLNVIQGFNGRFVGKEVLAKQACEIEIGRLKEPIGKQDQYAAAFGGFNFIRFNPDDSVDVEPLTHLWTVIEKIESSLLVFYTGVTRPAGEILVEQKANLEGNKDTRDILDRMVRFAEILRNDIVAGNVSSFGEILHESWMLKRQLASGVSSDLIDNLYERGRAAGAIGGKILGAGGGGFLLLTAPPERHEAISRALADYRKVPMWFERLGSTIAFQERNEK